MSEPRHAAPEVVPDWFTIPEHETPVPHRIDRGDREIHAVEAGTQQEDDQPEHSD